MDTIEVIIESPRAGQAKYKFDPVNNCFKLKKLLPLGIVFPYDFGFIPGTKGEDGDPLDVVVLSEFASFTGAHLSCRLIGALKAEQKEKGKNPVRNDRFFCIPEGSITFATIQSVNDLGKEHNKQIEEFFMNYNKVEGKEFKALGIIEASKAFSLIEKNGFKLVSDAAG